MTDEPTHDAPASPGSAPRGDATPAELLRPESRAARSLTDRSKAEDIPTDEPQAPPPHDYRPRVWPRVVGVLILLLGAGGAWVWQNPGFIQNTLGSVFPGSAGHDTEAATIKALDARVARLEQRPVPADLNPLAQRLDALEKRIPPTGQMQSQTSSQPPADLRPLLARLDALEARARDAQAASQQAGSASPAMVPLGSDLHPLLARLDALEKNAAEHAIDAGKVDALAAQFAGLSARDPAAEFRGKLDEVNHQLRDLTASDAKLAEGSDHALRLARLQAAGIALASGHALGPIQNAPPALARFATTAPPTEAALRLSFSAASQAALKVSLPDTEGKPFLGRVMARLQDFKLITVREGDHVVIGNSTAATLAHAHVLLDAGDLSGAVKAVATLSGPAAEKMAPWLADATALEAAREALASLAGNG